MKRFLAFLLAMVLLVSALPLTAVTAYAEETEGPVQEILP